MQKYLAVMQDSFREAMASRVLWLSLALITLLLAATAPLGYREELTWSLGENDVREWPDLMALVREAGQTPQRSPARRIWELMDAADQRRLAEVRIPGKDPDAANPVEFLSVFRAFRRAVNGIVESDRLYEPESFQSVPLASTELRALRDEGLDELTGKELARFNRLLMEAAFPDLIRSSPPTSIQVTYAGADVGYAYPLRGETLREALQFVVVLGVNWFVGVVGVFVAILVTASVIPRMFDSGSLHLLLSKPVSRWLLFVAKYLGGCTFILVGATYLVGGLWLVLGLRFGVWEPKLLVSIPIYLFVFAIYYSVAALAGLIWRSSIVAVGLTILFWLICFLVGSSKAMFEALISSRSRLVQLLEDGDALLAVNEIGWVHQWDAEQRAWNEVFVSPDQRQASFVLMFGPVAQFLPVGPVLDPDAQRLLSVQPTFPPAGLKLYVGERSAGWEAESRLAAPSGTRALFRLPDGQILAISSLGIFRLRGDPLAPMEQIEVFGFKIPLNLGGPFENISPDPPILLARPSAAAVDPVDGRLVLYSRGLLTVLQPDRHGRCDRLRDIHLDGEEREPAVLGIAADTLVVGREDGRLQIYEISSGQLRSTFQPESRNQSRFITASPDGRQFAIVFHNGQLWLYDPQADQIEYPPISGQGDISAAAFPTADRLLVAHRGTQVNRFALPDLELLDRHAPRLDLLEVVYRYGVMPLYTIFPKPGELDKTIQYLLSGRETERINRDDLVTAQWEVDPWTPLWSSAAFTLVVLVIACWYIERQDF